MTVALHDLDGVAGIRTGLLGKAKCGGVDSGEAKTAEAVRGRKTAS